MTCSIAGPISSLAAASKPQPGDLIPFRTPENIGPVAPGKVMQAHIHGLPAILIRVVAA
jgi:2-keto-4-pentenoate hydratase/2-oxohepta-3-ene-1,7-dioic acid hydratase in catechol pathway